MIRARNLVTISLLLIALLFTGCGKEKNIPPIITDKSATIGGLVGPQAVVPLYVKAEDPNKDSLIYSWTCTAGQLNVATGSSVEWTAPLSGTSLIKVVVSDQKGGQVSTEWSIQIGTSLQGTWYGEYISSTTTENCKIVIGDVVHKEKVVSSINHNHTYTFYKGTFETSILPDKVFEILVSDIPYEELGTGSEINPGWINVMYTGIPKTLFSVLVGTRVKGEHVASYHASSFENNGLTMKGWFCVSKYNYGTLAYGQMTLNKVMNEN